MNLLLENIIVIGYWAFVISGCIFIILGVCYLASKWLVFI